MSFTITKIDATKTNNGNEFKIDRFYPATITSLFRIEPGPFAKPDTNEVAINFLVYDAEENKYQNYTTSIPLKVSENNNTKLIKLLRAVTGVAITSKHIPQTFDLEVLIGKQISLKFTRNDSGKFSILLFAHRKKENWVEMDQSKAETAAWAERRRVDEDIDEQLEAAPDDLDISAVLGSINEVPKETPAPKKPKVAEEPKSKKIINNDDGIDTTKIEDNTDDEITSQLLMDTKEEDNDDDDEINSSEEENAEENQEDISDLLSDLNVIGD